MRKTLTTAIASLFMMTLVPQPATAVRVCNTDDPNPDDLFELCIEVSTPFEQVTVVERNPSPDTERFCVPATQICIDVPHLSDLLIPDVITVVKAQVDEVHFDPKGRENVNKICRILTDEDCVPEERRGQSSGYDELLFGDRDGDFVPDGLVLRTVDGLYYLAFVE